MLNFEKLKLITVFVKTVESNSPLDHRHDFVKGVLHPFLRQSKLGGFVVKV